MKYKFFRNAAVLLLLTFSFHTIAFASPVPISHLASISEWNAVERVENRRSDEALGGSVPYIIYDIRHTPPLSFDSAQPVAPPLRKIAGQALVIYGSKLMDGAASAFGKLSEGLKKAFDNVINPVTAYTNMFNNFSQTLGGLNTISGLSKFIENGMLQFGLQVAKDSIDNRIEKSKMSAFAKSILTTVTSAGLDSIGNLYMDARYPTSAQTVPEAAGARGPPTGLAGLLESVKNLGRSLQGLAFTALKDAAGIVRTIFIGGNATDTASGKITNDNGSFYYTPLTYGSQPLSYENVIANEPRIRYGLDQVEGDYYRSFTDQGGITDIRFDPARTQVLFQKTVGNLTDRNATNSIGIGDYFNTDLMSGGSYSGTAGGMVNSFDGFINSSISASYANYYRLIGNQYIAGAMNLGSFVTGEFVKGFADIGRFGEGLGMASVALQDAWQSGEFGNLLQNGWNEVLQGRNPLLGMFGTNTRNINTAVMGLAQDALRAMAIAPMVKGLYAGGNALAASFENSVQSFGGLSRLIPELGNSYGSFRISGQIIPDDAFVRFDPTGFDYSIKKLGIRSNFFDEGKVWLAKYGDVKSILNAGDLETVLYRKELWPSTINKFQNGATLRLIRNADDTVFGGMTNATNGVRQWRLMRNISPKDIEILRKIKTRGGWL